MSTDDYAPRVLPVSWRLVPPPAVLANADVRCYESVFGLRVIFGVEDRGTSTGVWLHASTSRQNKLPTWADIREVKDLFIGRDRCALHLVPPEKDYVNLHKFTLHIWSRLDAPSVPVGLHEDG